jgi:hypothetical protein
LPIARCANFFVVMRTWQFWNGAEASRPFEA